MSGQTTNPRRVLLSLLLVSGCLFGGVPLLQAHAAEPVRLLPPDSAQGNAFYHGNRSPLLPSPLVKLPVGAIEPRGWLRTQLQLQADGFHGHLTEISRFLKKENNAWLSPTGEGEHGWEEVPYWLKGFISCAYLLNNERMIREAHVWVEGILNSQKPDGWFGPDKGRKGVAARNVGRDDLWPNMIALFALRTYYEHTGDRRVLELMTRYFRWELRVPDERFLPPFWQQQRAADNLQSVYWLYNRTGQPWLLDLAEKIYRNMANWTDGIPSWHNVNIAQAFDSPAVYYQQSKDRRHLAAAERNWKEVRRLFGQVPGGMFGGDENCRPGYGDPRQAIESCGVVEEMFSDETMLRISGDLVWADRCENVAFNTFPATMTPDLKALRYLTAPNLVVSDKRNHAPGFQNRGPMLWYNPHIHRCCQHNIGHGWPYFTESLWAATQDNGLAAVLYAPCAVRAKVGDGTEVEIEEDTHYPFDETIRLRVRTPRPVRFPLKLRVPGWCEKASVRVNGRPVPGSWRPRRFVVLDRQWQDGDQVELRLPMSVRLTVWKANQNSVSVHYGPLTFSLKIGEKYVRSGGTDRWPAWEVFPTTPWNYGLVLDQQEPTRSFRVVRRPVPDGQPFEAEAAPIQLVASAKRIPQWKLDEFGLVGKLAPSPVRTDQPVETVTLIPMGCARLRLSAFPVVGEGPDARPWPEPPRRDVRVEASHCFERDTVRAAVDNLLPRRSNDHSIPRMTWWPHRGTSEWLAFYFEKPKRVSSVEVYWFDDTGRGQCRVPERWRVEWLDGQAWRPVKPLGPYPTDRDTFNRVQFAPVTTRALRLVVQLQPHFSAGVLEVRIR